MDLSVTQLIVSGRPNGVRHALELVNHARRVLRQLKRKRKTPEPSEAALLHMKIL